MVGAELAGPTTGASRALCRNLRRGFRGARQRLNESSRGVGERRAAVVLLPDAPDARSPDAVVFRDVSEGALLVAPGDDGADVGVPQHGLLQFRHGRESLRSYICTEKMAAPEYQTEGGADLTSDDGDESAVEGPEPSKLDPRLRIYENPDKVEPRPSGPGPWMPMWPFRALFAGPPGVGKRNMILNLIDRLEPKPSAVHLVHIDPDTVEYDVLQEIGCPIYIYDPSDFPTAENISDPVPVDYEGAPRPEGGGDGESSESERSERSERSEDTEDEEEIARHLSRVYGTNPLVIVDEVTRDLLSPEQASRFERLVNFVSTHRNCAVITSIQGVTSLPPKVRRAFDNFCLWKQPDSAASVLAANRCGIPPAMLEDLFGLCHDRHESIWVDAAQPPDSEWRYRLCFTTPIRCETTVTAEDY